MIFISLLPEDLFFPACLNFSTDILWVKVLLSRRLCENEYMVEEIT